MYLVCLLLLSSLTHYLLYRPARPGRQRTTPGRCLGAGPLAPRTSSRQRVESAQLSLLREIERKDKVLIIYSDMDCGKCC